MNRFHLLPTLLLGALALTAQPRLEQVPKATDPSKQSPPKQPPKQQPQDQGFVVRSGTYEVALPITFLDLAGDFVTDIERPEVTLTDNRVVQRLQTFEIAYRPLSMVILIDTSTRMEGVIANLRTSGILFTQLVMGETGDAAVLTYDQTIEVRQPFTKEADLVEKAFKSLKAEGGQSKLTDAVFRALGMLSNRAEDRRKVIVILGEGRDLGSDTSKAQALREAQLANVSIYAVELSSFKAMAKRPLPETTSDPMAPGSKPQPPGIPVGSQTGVVGFNMWPALVESTRAVKSLLWDHPLKIYSSGTGSDHINATNNHAVEDAVQRIGRELHSQYWVSYRPNNLRGEEYHNIEVKVNRPGVRVRARPGYLHVPSVGEVTEPDKLPTKP